MQSPSQQCDYPPIKTTKKIINKKKGSGVQAHQRLLRVGAQTPRQAPACPHGCSGAGSGLARLVGPELHAAHQGTQGLAVLHVAGVPGGQHIALGLLVEQPQDLLVMDLRAGVAGRNGSVQRDTRVQGPRAKGRLDTLGR